MSYTLIAKHESDKRTNRDGYISAMLELMKEDDKVVHIDCDLMSCINAGKLLAAYPDRTFNAGIAEQNAMAVAGGMAATGMKVFVHSFGCFASRRAFDQAYLACGYSLVPVHVIGSDPGVTAAYNGGTHMPFEDAGLYMSIPNAIVIDSCDYVQTYALTKKLAAAPQLSYMRLILKGFKTIYGDGSDFEIGKGVTLKDGKDITIIATGLMVNEARIAAENLAKEGIHARVINIHTIKPLDEELVLKAAAECGKVITCEEHNILGGLGEAVCGVLSEKCPTPVRRIGVNDEFGHSGPAGELLKQFGLCAEHIVEVAKDFCK